MTNSRIIIWVMVVVVIMATSQVMGVIEFNDGLIHDIDYVINDDVYVDWQAPGMQTTLNWLEGAQIVSDAEVYGLRVYEDGRINMSGGTLGDDGWLQAFGNSWVEVSGGTIGENLMAFDSSHLIISGGNINNQLTASSNGQISLLGGTINHLDLWDSGQLNMYSGWVGYLNAQDDSQSTVSGGVIDGGLQALYNSRVTISGGSIYNEIFAGSSLGSHNSVITIKGSNFTINDISVDYGQYFASDYASGVLTGTLASGDTLNNTFYIYDNSSIVLVPEPSTLLSLGFGALALRRRKRR